MKLFGLCLLVALFYSCGRDPLVDRATALPWTQTTAGVRVRSEFPLMEATKDAIDRSLAAKGAEARCLNYVNELEPRSYSVAVLKADGIRDGVPVLKFVTDEYRGTQWDQGGFVYVGGFYNSNEDIIVIPEQTDLAALERIVGYEAEHRILLKNDRAAYERTRIHGPTTGHPLIQCVRSKR